MQTSTRDVQVISYKSPLFPSHWALFIPKVGKPELGTVIHVTGDAHKGFVHQFKRNYNHTTSSRASRLIPLGKVASSNIVDSQSDTESEDQSPTDTLEEIALAVPAPEKSLVSPSASKGTRVPVRNCQTWMYDYVAALVARNILEASAVEALSQVPKTW
ncbi:unnamed protein product [Rhizoctonia solani]|uniref:Uncharacterized protein n=1 Tax=Rhizoctonia solani TaxID=456999 RepID=A0A8H3HP90_9AGAM|nr:unnamed protein product [Rhizoctonia solani]